MLLAGSSGPFELLRLLEGAPEGPLWNHPFSALFLIIASFGRIFRFLKKGDDGLW
jgi:hypothetical protein